MAQEFDERIRDERLDRAARLALGLRSETPSAGLEILAARAAEEVFRDDAATPEGGLSAARITLVAEVLRRARTILGQPHSGADSVEVASRDSFPASDPPAWIWRR